MAKIVNLINPDEITPAAPDFAKKNKENVLNNNCFSESIFAAHKILKRLHTTEGDNINGQRANYENRELGSNILRIAFLLGCVCAALFCIGLLMWRFATSVSSVFSSFRSHSDINIKFSLMVSCILMLMCICGLFMPKKMYSIITR